MTAHLVDPVQEGDPVLLSLVRAGDADAYGRLFERHREAAVAFARRLAGASHADDLVAEAFAKVLDALQRDLGPTVSFRSYLLTSVRSIWANTVRTERRYDLVEDYEQLAPFEALTVTDDPDRRFDNGAVAAAYRSLPERWQAVLWYTAVEGLPHSEVALHLGIKPNAVAALSFRAREGLRQAYLAAHLGDTTDEACLVWAPLIPSHARGTLDRRKRPGLEAHLDGCLRCTAALADLDDVNNRLGAVLLPVVLGGGLLGGTTWASLIGHAGAASGATGKAVGIVSAAKTGLLVTVAAGVVGASLAVPLLLDAGTPGRPSTTSSLLTVRDPGPSERARSPRPLPSGATPAVRSARPVPTTAAAPRRDQVPATARQPVPPAAGPQDGAALSPGAAVPGTATTTEPPRSESTQPEPTEPGPTEPGPSVVPGLSPDIELGAPVVDRATVGAHQLVRLRLPVANVRRGAVVDITFSNLRGRPVRLDAGWSCPGTIDGELDAEDVVPSTSVACTWTGTESAYAELVLAVHVVGTSQVTASASQAPGVVDPVAGNNTMSLTLEP